MTVYEFQELLSGLDDDVNDGELCVEDADVLARKYCADCLKTEIKNMRTSITDGVLSRNQETSTRIFIEETRRIYKMVYTSGTWWSFLKDLKAHVRNLETSINEILAYDNFTSFNPSDYVDCAKYWLSVFE